MEKYVKRSPWYCPKCGDIDHTELVDMDIEDMCVTHTIRCTNCGCEFEEFFNAAYSGFAIEDENGRSEYDEYGDEIDFTPNEDCNIYLNDDDPSDEDIEEALGL